MSEKSMNTGSYRLQGHICILLISIALLMGGCGKPVIIGGVDATDLDPLEHPPRKRVFISKEPPPGVAGAADPDKAHMYINKQSGGVKLERNKVYHWVAEGGEIVSSGGDASDLDSGIIGNDAMAEDVAIIPIETSAESVEPGFLPIVPVESPVDAGSSAEAVDVAAMDTALPPGDESVAEAVAETSADLSVPDDRGDVAYLDAESSEPVPVIVDEGPDPDHPVDLSVQYDRMDASPEDADLPPGYTMSVGLADDPVSDLPVGLSVPDDRVDVAYLDAESSEPVPVIVDEAPDPVALFDVSEVVGLVQGYASVMQARLPGRLSEMFIKGAELSFSMSVPGQGQVSEKYDIASFTEAHRRGWKENVDYDIDISDIIVTVSDDGTTAVAQGVVAESMTKDKVRVAADYDMFFYLEKVGKSLLIVGAEAEGSIEGVLIGQAR